MVDARTHPFVFYLSARCQLSYKGPVVCPGPATLRFLHPLHDIHLHIETHWTPHFRHPFTFYLSARYPPPYKGPGGCPEPQYLRLLLHLHDVHIQIETQWVPGGHCPILQNKIGCDLCRHINAYAFCQGTSQ